MNTNVVLMLKPKEEAIGLVREFYNITEQEGYYEEFEEAKKCALVCVGRMLEFAYDIEWEKKEEAISKLNRLKKVKQEIIKLKKL
jgi:hypothetical protein